ncbi:MAG: GTPase ObgE [Planctomycetota bacterium]
MFRDECTLEVRAGKGGDGLVSFRREKYVPRGGPDGGDGGDGGDILLRATGRVSSLLAVGRSPRYRAGNGEPGGTSRSAGRDGTDLVLEVPVGTQVFDARRGHLLRDLAAEGQELLVAHGGGGGRGNASFATAVRQTPRHAEPGEKGEERTIRLELKLFAEVGLVGLPNAGKSTLLARVTAARPKIADYPFTTLVPHVGIAAVGEFDSLVLADLPGLIEGAAEGAGLGHRFLRHVERCRVLLQLVDVSEGALEVPEAAFHTIDSELTRYSAALAERPRLVAATKCEDAAARAKAADLSRSLGRPVRAISAQTGEGIAALLGELHGIVRGG